VSTLENTLNWIQKEQSRFLYICFFVSFVDFQMHTVIIFVLITSVVVYFCSRLPADLKYLDVLKTRVHSIICHHLNLITDYYFSSSSFSIIGRVPEQKAQNFGGEKTMACSPVPKVGRAAALFALSVSTPIPLFVSTTSSGELGEKSENRPFRPVTC